MNGLSGPLKIKQYLDLAIQQQASDLHLVGDRPPIFRIQGRLVPAKLPAFDHATVTDMLMQLMNEKQKKMFEEFPEFDMSFQLDQYSFRVNIHRNKGHLAATIRMLPTLMKDMHQLGLPPIVTEMCGRLAGLILIVGRAGTGKTTTMTHMVQYINEKRPAKIITVEDPIEYVFESKNSLIVQREVGSDTPTFATGLKYALRQDPDVVVIGEMRDLESISMALTTAETGHLVFATLHAPDAIEAINRIIDVYPGDKQNQIRVQMAENLSAVVGQQLLPSRDGKSRVLATEIVNVNLAVRNNIRRNSLAEIRSQMESGREGMYTLEQCLSSLFKKGLISEEVALSHAKYPRLLELS